MVGCSRWRPGSSTNATGADGVPGRVLRDLQATFVHVDADRDDAVPRRPGRVRRTPLGDGQGLRSGRPFDRIEQAAEVVLFDESSATVCDALADRPGRGAIGRAQAVHLSPRSPPFMTSTLQQEAGASCACRRRWRCRPLSGSTRTATSPTCGRTRDVVRRRPERRLTPDPRQGDACPRRAVPLRQQGEERPGGPRGDPVFAGDSFRTPDQVCSELGNAEFRLYELIWQRTIVGDDRRPASRSRSA